MAEVSTEGPKGWMPAMEKDSTRRDLRSRVDDGVQGNLSRKVEGPRIRAQIKMDSLKDEAVETIITARNSARRAARDAQGLFFVHDVAEAVSKITKIPAVRKRIAEPALQKAGEKVDKTVEAIATKVAADIKFEREINELTGGYLREERNAEKRGETRQLHEVRREPRLAPNLHDRKRAGKQ